MYILCIFEQMTQKKPEARFSAHLRQDYEPWFSAGGEWACTPKIMLRVLKLLVTVIKSVWTSKQTYEACVHKNVLNA